MSKAGRKSGYPKKGRGTSDGFGREFGFRTSVRELGSQWTGRTSKDKRTFGKRSPVEGQGSSSEGAVGWKATPELVSQDRERVSPSLRAEANQVTNTGRSFARRSGGWQRCRPPFLLALIRGAEGRGEAARVPLLSGCLTATASEPHVTRCAESAQIIASTRHCELNQAVTDTKCHLRVWAGRLAAAIEAAGVAGTKETERVPRDRSSHTGFGHRSFRSDIASELALVGEGHRHDLRRRQAASRAGLNRVSSRMRLSLAMSSAARLPRPHRRAQRINIPESLSSGASSRALSPTAGNVQPGETLLGGQVMALAIDPRGEVKNCKVISEIRFNAAAIWLRRGRHRTVRGKCRASTNGRTAARRLYDGHRLWPFRARRLSCGDSAIWRRC